MINPQFFNQLSKASLQTISVSHTEGGMSTARRALARPKSSKLVNLRLVPCGDDLVDWVEAPPAIPGMKKRRRGFGSSAEAKNVISFEKIAPSEVVSFLVRQDKKFTPNQGLFRAREDLSLIECPTFPESGDVLLFIHGTFSTGENLLEGINANPSGPAFFKEALKKYGGNVLFFNHPTISVSPVLNACDLQQFIGHSQANIDIIAHSRGGLVTRWWCETYDPHLERCKNAILVGSPLAGTGLAAPPNIRKTLRLMTSYGNALSDVASWASAAFPVFGIVNTLLSVITSVTSIAAKTPLADGLLAMIPGLHAQSRVGNNQELVRLHQSNGSADRYAAIQANFESEKLGWRFWKYFNKQAMKDKAKDLATNTIFEGANDCVVDVDSMSFLSETSRIGSTRIYDFETSSKVHHTNYFYQPATLDHFRKILKL